MIVTRTIMKIVGCEDKTHRLVKMAHKAEHPLHLSYFGLMVLHYDYHMAAIGCLVVGVIAMLPDKGQAEA